MPKEKVLCYNSGCGKTYDPDENKEDSCQFHSGVPVFHDAYKGWSCCKKKCIDFTEFLNIKGCTFSYHSNVKPPEAAKPQKTVDDEIIEVKRSAAPKIERPPFSTAMTELRPDCTESLKTKLLTIRTSSVKEEVEDGIQIGTLCKNNSCKTAYESPETNLTSCTFHSGTPIFHEGLKYWSCCQKKTTDFDTFLAQVGCETGKHVWRAKKNVAGDVKCRVDWHQTDKFVCYTVFGKNSDPNNSKFEINPVRLKISVFFPEQNGKFEKDIELNGIIDVENSKVMMSPAKIEIQLKKSEFAKWPRFETIKYDDKKENFDADESEIVSQVESVDLSCL